MALNAKHVYAPAPMQTPTTGAVAVAPEGTARPTDARTALTNAWDDGGYVDENGISIALTRSTTPLRDWSKTTVRNLLSEFGGAITLNFLQVDEFAAKRVFGEGNVTVTPANAQHGELMTVAIGADLPPVEAWCFSMKDGDARIRVCVPRGQVTDAAQMDFRPDAGHVVGGTLQCYDDGTGKSIYVIYDDGEVVSG